LKVLGTFELPLSFRPNHTLNRYCNQVSADKSPLG